MQPKRAIVYVRVSTTDQADNGVSLDNQERACGDWAFRNQVQVLRTFREEGKSAKTMQRPELKAMLDYLSENYREIDYIIVYQIDRLTRNFMDFADFMRLLATYKISLRDSASNINADESAEFMQQLQASMAQYENKLKSRRVTENMKHHAAAGYRMHQAPYGLKNVRDEAGRPIVAPIEPAASNIAYLLTEFAKGTYTKGQLFRLAVKMGMKQLNGKPLRYQFVDKILRQPLYAGLEKSSLTNQELIHSSFAGIVPEWVYHTNQSLLESRQKHSTDGYKEFHPDYPLRKFLTCATCGHLIRGSASTGASGKKYPRYHCTTPECHSAYIAPQELHVLWKQHLHSLAPDETRLRLLQKVILRVWHDEIRTTRERREKIRKRIDALGEQKINATEKLVNGSISVEEKNALVERINQQLSTLQSEDSTLGRQIGTKEQAIDYAVRYINNAEQLWENASPEARRIFQFMIYPDGVPFDFKKKQFGTARTSALYTLASIKKDPSATEESLLVTLRGATWNTYWGGFVELSGQLEELGIGDDAEAGNV